jgi:hypothetical protein
MTIAPSGGLVDPFAFATNRPAVNARAYITNTNSLVWEELAFAGFSARHSPPNAPPDVQEGLESEVSGVVVDEYGWLKMGL